MMARPDVSEHLRELGPMPDHIRERFIANMVSYYRDHPERLPAVHRRATPAQAA
jgi:hypothetical protein